MVSTTRYGLRTFRSDVRVWDSLPNELRVAESYSSFVGCSIVGTAPYEDAIYAQSDCEVFSVHSALLTFSFDIFDCVLLILFAYVSHFFFSLLIMFTATYLNQQINLCDCGFSK